MVRLLVVALAAAVVAVGVLVAFAATRPPVFEVRRTALIKAPPEKIFALIDDLRGWRAWSPYENLDPGMARDYSGPESGPGAAYAWRSDGRAGVGRMAIVEAEAPRRIVIALDFVQPMRASDMAEFRLQPEGEGATRVTWSMSGPYPLPARIVGAAIGMERLVGRDFEAGLANLKAASEP